MGKEGLGIELVLKATRMKRTRNYTANLKGQGTEERRRRNPLVMQETEIKWHPRNQLTKAFQERRRV